MTPWLENKDWAENEIRSGANFVQYVLWGIALIWCLLSFPMVLDYESILRKAQREPITYIAFIFPLVGVGLIAAAINATLKWLKFGATPLRLDPFPGSLGGHVGGSIETNIAFTTDIKCAVTLSCLNSYVSGSGDNRSRKESVLWQSEGFCEVVPLAKGTGFKFRFNVPNDLPVSDVKKQKRYNFWRVNVSAKLDGADFVRAFEIPVFDTNGQTSSILRGSEEHIETVESASKGVESIADIRSIAGGVEIWFPAFQRPRVGIMMLIFGLIFTGIGIAMPIDEAPLILTIAFTGIGGLILLLGVAYLGKALLVQVTSAGIKSRRFFMGLPITTKTLSANEFKRFEIKKGASMSSGAKTTIIYQIYAQGENGKVRVAERLSGKPEVELVKECFETYLPSQ